MSYQVHFFHLVVLLQLHPKSLSSSNITFRLTICPRYVFCNCWIDHISLGGNFLGTFNCLCFEALAKATQSCSARRYSFGQKCFFYAAEVFKATRLSNVPSAWFSVCLFCHCTADIFIHCDTNFNTTNI